MIDTKEFSALGSPTEHILTKWPYPSRVVRRHQEIRWIPRAKDAKIFQWKRRKDGLSQEEIGRLALPVHWIYTLW